MKKITAIVLCLIMSLNFVACGKRKNTDTNSDNSAPVSSPESIEETSSKTDITENTNSSKKEDANSTTTEITASSKDEETTAKPSTNKTESKNESSKKPSSSSSSKKPSSSKSEKTDPNSPNFDPYNKKGYVYIPGEGYVKIDEEEGESDEIKEFDDRDFWEVVNDPDNEIIGY